MAEESSEAESPSGLGDSTLDCDVGSKVWFQQPSGLWEIGVVSSVDVDGKVFVNDKFYKLEDVVSWDASHALDLDNICLMNNMHEAPLLDMLRRRFLEKKIYTYASDILISLNPFETIPGLYENPNRYYAIDSTESSSWSAVSEDVASVDEFDRQTSSEKPPPHVYRIANNALRALCNGRSGTEFFDQSVIISGESGAGKTENSKYVLSYLIEANNLLSASAQSSSETSFAEYLKEVLVQSSIVLEAFGNAKTLRNDNSSRFGKYIKLLYSCEKAPGDDSKPYPKLMSAQTETFLLEKSRLTNVGKGERCYHVFYQLLSALSDEALKAELGLQHHGIEDFRILSQGECFANANDASDFSDTCAALSKLQISESEFRELVKVLAMVLHLGNLQFEVVDEDSDRVDLSCMTCSMEQLSNGLGLHPATLKLALTTQSMRVRGRASVRTKILTLDDVANNANALLKWLYSKLFDWIVKKINHCHTTYCDSSVEHHFIGILDIFGFEILKTNSFEQLCINYTNERLQQQFNQHIFVHEQDMYRAEGLEWTSISFKDNQSVIDLISSARKPLGLLLLLEEQGLLNRKPDDQLLLASFNQQHEIKEKGAQSDVLYSKSKFGNNSFVVRHFAGEVTYVIDGFLVKNNDSLQEDLMNTLRFTSSVFLRHVMGFANSDSSSSSEPGYIPSSAASTVEEPSAGPPVNRAGPMKKMAAALSVSSQFRSQLDALMSTLYSTAPHYIKCIKSNNAKGSGLFEAGLVTQQLRYSGVLEVVRIRREGFPVRMTFRDFFRRFRVLLRGKPGKIDSLDDSTLSLEDLKRHCALILTIADVDVNVQIGNSKIFLRDRGLAAMRAAVDIWYGRRALRIQTRFRVFRLRRQYHRVKHSAALIKRGLLMVPVRRHYRRMLQAAHRIQIFYASRMLRKQFVIHFHRKLSATCIQRHFRGFRQRKCFRNMHRAAVKLQSRVRCFLQRQRFLRMLKGTAEVDAVIRIQSHVRALRLYRRFQMMRRSVLKLQTALRGSTLRRRFRRLQRAAVRLQALVRRSIHYKRFLHVLSHVILLQSAWRCVRRKRQFQQARKAAVLLQAFVRRSIQQRRFLRTKRSATRVQTTLRRYIAHKRYREQRQLCCVVRIQSIARCFVQRRRFEYMYVSSLALQTIVRCFLQRRRFLRCKSAAVKIQALVRMQRAVKLVDRQFASVVLVQSLARRRIALRRFELRMASLLLLQSWFRQFPLHLRYRTLVFYSIVLQTAFRRHMHTQRYVRIRFATLKIQTIARAFLCINRYRIAYASVVAIQSLVRCFIARRRYELQYGAVLGIQTAFRRYAAQTRYELQRWCVQDLQRLVRGFLARRYVLRCFLAIATLQSFGRMIVARNAFDEALVSVISMQTFVRGRLLRTRFLRQKASVVLLQRNVRRWRMQRKYRRTRSLVCRLQSFGRMLKWRARFQEVLFATILIQSTMRRILQRARYMRLRQRTIRLQAWFRAEPLRWGLQAYRYFSTVIAKYVRRWRNRRAFVLLKGGVVRSQRAVRAFLRNQQLHRRVQLLHNASSLFTTSVAAMQQQLRLNPDDVHLRYRTDRFRTFLHSLLVRGDAAAAYIAQQLRPSCKDLFATDANGRRASHFLAQQPSLATLQVLTQVLDTFKPLVQTVAIEGLDEDDNDNDNVAAEGHNAAIKQAIHDSVRRSKLKEGWLKKKRGGMMYQRRWVVLTDDYMIYYKGNDTSNHPKFAIPLEGCTVQRVPGSREPTFEVFAPNMGVKKSIFGSSTKKSVVFLCENEQEMQEWLTPLRAVAGVDTLRSSPVHYVSLELRALWLQATDRKGESPVHALIRQSSTVKSTEALDVAVKLLAWMLEQGHAVNLQNEHGNTALHLALVLNVHVALVRVLVQKGANVSTLKNRNGKSCLDLVQGDAQLKQMYGAEVLQPPRGSLSGGSVQKMKGYSYLSLYLGQQDFDKAQATVGDQPVLVVAAYNSKRQLVEAGKELRGPAWTSAEQAASSPSASPPASATKHIYWGVLWHMQTPLENLEEGSYVLVEYKARSDGPVVSAAQVSLDRQTVNSGALRVSTTMPTDATGRPLGNPIAAQNERATMQIEVLLHRKSRPLALEDVFSQN